MGTIKDRRFASVDELNAAVEALLKEELQASRATPHAIMLSGGNTPLPIYASIAGNPIVASDGAWVTFTDDRHVPFESPESNMGNTLGMIQAVGLPRDRVIAINPEVSLEQAAEEFEAGLRDFFSDGGTISVAMLGIGPDTHTCSLFTQDDLERSRGRIAIPVPKDTPPSRVSVTPECLQKIDRILVVAVGEGKTPVIERLLSEPLTTIAGRALARCENVEVWRA